MKWIGQNIYDLISRFRNDVYLEDISTGTIASGAHLGLDSNNKIVKAVDGGGDLTSIVAGTGLSGTSLTGPIPTLNVDASQTQITAVGTITTGVWSGTAIASARLDADTAHLTTTQTFTGAKTFTDTVALTGTGRITGVDTVSADTDAASKGYADRPAEQIVLMRSAFKDDIGTTKHYIPLQSELEQTSATHEMNSFVAPFAGKLLKIMFRGSGNFSGGDFTFTLEQIPRNVAFNTSATTLETIAITGPTNNTTDPNMVTVNFVGGGGTNAFTAGDIIQVGIQSDTDVTGGSSKLFFTLVFEFDFSGLA